ncbi:PREDICTED: protein LSM12 homolog B-like [Rhagoletis zephyria]|uniref:protein LSM12 homolog B-like n=1 Tax=Rhagoletis zephyria TaxID=28612 RepID=UPI00081149D1|nr:PREDICTED: protein LSM12 homolog B-like [Rhagoletis zephyria]
MSSALSEHHIFSPGALVEVQTVTTETITGEVLAFEYDDRLLILKSQSSNGSVNSSNVTCLNLDLCGAVKIISEPDAERLAAEGIVPNAKLPEIDLKKLDERLANAISERRLLVEAYKNGAGLEGVSLYTRLQKTVGESFGISWDRDSIIIGKNIRIAKPYTADCISFFNTGPKPPPNLKTSLNYAKQLVEKYWNDQNKASYNLTPLPSGGSPQARSTTTSE